MRKLIIKSQVKTIAEIDVMNKVLHIVSKSFNQAPEALPDVYQDIQNLLRKEIRQADLFPSFDGPETKIRLSRLGESVDLFIIE